MTPLPIPMIDFFLASLNGARALEPYYNKDYQMRWEEIGEGIFETSWDFLEGRHERTMLAWTGVSEIRSNFLKLVSFIKTNHLL